MVSKPELYFKLNADERKMLDEFQYRGNLP